MFDKIECKLLISVYMTKDEYKNLIKKYMTKLNIPYITAKQYICLKQMKKFERENNIKYLNAFLHTYHDIIENGYNISMYNIYMDVVNEIEILETDVRDCNEKCERVNCHAIDDAIMSS